MKKHCYCLFVVFILCSSFRVSASEQIFRVLSIQSHSRQMVWNGDLMAGLNRGFRDRGVEVQLTTEYLEADYWSFRSEKVIMKRICQRARENKVDLIITQGDEALFTLFACGDSLPLQLPVVYFGVKYPDRQLLDKHPNLSGFTANPDFLTILQQAKAVFPQRKEVVCVVDNSSLSNKGKDDFLMEWVEFQKANPDYKLIVYNTEVNTTNEILSAICYERSGYKRVVVIPKWTPFISFVIKNSKAPVFAAHNVGPSNGVFASYDVNAYTAAKQAAHRAVGILKGDPPLPALKQEKATLHFVYDFSQLKFFKVGNSKLTSFGGEFINEPFWEKYKLLMISWVLVIITLLIGFILWLIRANRYESMRRQQAQNRLLLQNRLVEQRNEFDHIFHSIRDGVITYDVNLHIRFVNRALLKMANLPYDDSGRSYDGQLAGTIFKLYHGSEDVLHLLLNEVAYTKHSVSIPPQSFLKEVRSDRYFPASGEIVPILSNDQLIGMVLSVRNISDQEIKKRFFEMAVSESSVYPWTFDRELDSFLFPTKLLVRFGCEENSVGITRSEMEKIVYPDDRDIARSAFNNVLVGDEKGNRLSFRVLNNEGEYEWWEFRSSVIAGWSKEQLFNIVGVCQSVQRYKNTEQELRDARDKALRADKLKSNFLSNMSHEIRTPLNAIVGFSSLLNNMEGFSEEEIGQFVVIINKNCDLLLALISDILDLSRIESDVMEFVFAEYNLSLLLRTIYDSQRLNTQPGVELELCMPQDETKCIKTDEFRLLQVMNNLISNSAKFTHCGKIVFGYEEDEDPNYIQLFVEDTGVGIAQDKLNVIFDRFYKGDDFTQGVGLGLSVCQTIVDRFGGTISVVSELGKGSRFTVRLPNDKK